MRWFERLVSRIQREPKDTALTVGWIGMPLVPWLLWNRGSGVYVLALLLIFPLGFVISHLQGWVAGVERFDSDALERVRPWKGLQWLLWTLEAVCAIVFFGGIGVMAGFVVRNLPK